MGTGLRVRQAAGEIAYRAGVHRISPNSLAVLMYHAVTQQDLRDPAQQSVSLRQFSEQMETLRDLGARWVSLEEGVRLLKEVPGCGPMASVVFDDGYVGVHDLALKVLVRHRIPATLFLATESIGRYSFPQAPPQLGRPLTWEEVRTLAREAGCAIGSHGQTHRALARLPSDEIRWEIKTSKATIEGKVGQPCRSFAYPYGATGTFSAQTRQFLKEEGFAIACTSLWGRCRPGADPMGLPRIRVSWCDTPHEIKKSLAGCYDWYRIFQ